jgi:hypothetical protein
LVLMERFELPIYSLQVSCLTIGPHQLKTVLRLWYYSFKQTNSPQASLHKAIPWVILHAQVFVFCSVLSVLAFIGRFLNRKQFY